MKNNLYKAALLAALSVALSPAAKAANNGDVFVGLNDAAGPTSAQNDYVIDLGSYTDFTTTGTVQGTINSTMFNTAFGTDGNALNEVAVGAVAGGQIAGGNNYLFSTGNLSGIPSASPFKNSQNSAGTVEGGEYASAGSISDTTWSFEVAVSPTQPDEYGNGVASETGNPMSYLTGGTATLDLYESTFSGTRGASPSAWTLLGTLTIDANSSVSDPSDANADTITFTGVDAVPEPGTFGLFAIGGLLAHGLRRRFFRAA